MSGLEVARQSVRGSLILFVGNFASTAILTAAVIVIARLLGPSAYGVYTLSLVIPGIFQLFLGLGVNAAVTRYAAYYVSLGKVDEAKRFTKNAIVFLLLFGIGLTLLSFASATWLSALLLQRSDLGQYAQVASLLILGQAIFQSSLSATVGWNGMVLAGFSSVLQSLLKLSISVALIILGFGVLGSVIGHVAAYIVTGALTVSALYLLRLRRTDSDRHFVADVREMVRYGLPVFAGGVVSGLASSYLTIVLANIATNAVVGYYQAAANVTVPIGLVSSSIATALFPAFATLDGVKGDTALALKYSVKYVAFFVTPIVMFLISSSSLLFEVIYGQSYSPGVLYLNLLALASLPVVIGSTVLPVFFQGLGRTRLTMYAAIAGALALGLLSPLLGIGLGLGVEGLIYAILLANGVGALVALALASRNLRANIDFGSAAGTIGASIIALVAASITARIFPANLPTLLLNVILFLSIYLTAAPLLRAITTDDLKRLRVVLGELKFVGRISEPFVRYMEVVTKTLGRNREKNGS